MSDHLNAAKTVKDDASAAGSANPPGEAAVSPQRIQLSRRKGWRMPDNTVTVSRPGPWGNPFVVGKHGDAAYCVDLYKAMLAGLLRVGADPDIAALERTRRFVADNAAELRGKNLACWCIAGAPCHADILLKIANPSNFED